MAGHLGNLNWVDLALLGALALSVLIGLWRGLVFEVLSLLSWVIAWVLAQAYGAEVALRLNLGTPGQPQGIALGFVLVFFATLIACGLLARLARLLISATPLSVIDRLLGAGFGLVRGVLLLLVLATALSLTPVAQSADWRASLGANWLGSAIQQLRPLMPDAMRQYVSV
jgi:membrane protein required for colicin V production